ncbi:MAG TPA: hypothetical protein VJA21_16095 [Verrucomicrobiae bacterium]
MTTDFASARDTGSARLVTQRPDAVPIGIRVYARSVGDTIPSVRNGLAEATGPQTAGQNLRAAATAAQ